MLSFQFHLLLLLVSLFNDLFIVAQQCEPCTRNDAGQIEEPGHGGSAAFSCDLAALEAQSLDNGTAACRDHQLMMWQRDCCPDPPNNHCSLCDSYNENKTIPRFEHQQFGSPDLILTCGNVAERKTYLDRDGLSSEYGDCDHTERGRARSWCECEGVFPDCTLKCPDGSDIPDPTKADPLFGETCARWMFETSALSSEECNNIEESLFFSAISFCCNLDPPKTCSICPPEEELLVNSTEDVFRGKTCAQVQEYADWLPGDSCSGWFSRLLDDPFDPTAKCCVPRSGSPAANPTTETSGTVRRHSPLLGLLLLQAIHFFIQ